MQGVVKKISSCHGGFTEVKAMSVLFFLKGISNYFWKNYLSAFE